MSDIDRFRELVRRLRGEDGCPWDRKQTIQTLAPYIAEEADEVVRAVESGESEDICEELGDVMLIVCMMAQVAEEEGLFGFDDCVRMVSEKVVRRHPHVFGGVDVEGEQDVIANWREIKEMEKREKRRRRGG